MKIKKLLTPLLLILLLASMVVFGAPQPVGPYFDDTYLEYGNDGLNVKTATVTDGDTTHVPTSDNVYDFCETTQDYMQDLEDDIAPKLGGNLDANDHAILENVTTVTTTHTLTVAEAGVVLVSASSDYTITLPTAVGNTGLTYKFKKTDANYNCITLDGDGTETINYENADGVPKETYARLNTYCAEVTVVSDGSNWQVIDEALGQVPRCKVYLSAIQYDLIDNTWTVLEFDTEVYDIGNNFNTTTHYFTCPVDGIYLVSFTLFWVNSSIVADKSYTGSIYTIGITGWGESVQQSSVTGHYLTNEQTKMRSCNKDDDIGLKAKQSTGENTVDLQGGNEAYCNMEIRLISKE